MTMKQKIQYRAGFSLVEVIVAMGIVAFAFVGLLGIIPSGLSSFRQSVDQARALTALNMVASAARNSKFEKIESDDANYSFPQFFSDNATTTYHVRQADYSLRFYLLEDGTIRLKTDTTSPPKAVLYLLIDSPGTFGAPAGNNMVAGPLKINAFVVWPYRPGTGTANDDAPTLPTTRKALAERIGTRSFLDTVITHYPEPVK
jgi:uncharacterized protein (TIGR02598 family)